MRLSVYALTEAFGLNRRTVSKRLGRRDVPTRYQILGESGLASAARRYESGMSPAAVTKRLAVSPGTVRNAFKDAGRSLRLDVKCFGYIWPRLAGAVMT
jgi:hypothetical protein